jgi:hypothetical protein
MLKGHRQMMRQLGSRTHMAPRRPVLESPPGWAGLSNLADRRGASQSMPEQDLRQPAMNSAARS